MNGEDRDRLLEETRDAAKETHDTVLRLETMLIGMPGTDDKGMAGKLNDVCEDYARLKTRFWILIGILSGSGIITGSTLAAINGF